MDSLWKDFAFGARTLRKNPGFAITALVTLALGIGASTAIFSVVNAVLLRPLPYARADRLYFLTSDMKARNVLDFPVAPADVKDLREGATQFDGIAGVFTFRAPLTGDDGQPEQVNTALATTNFFHLLGAPIAAGRDFQEDDATPQPPPPQAAPGAAAPGVAQAPPPPRFPAIAILSHGFWMRRYGGSRDIIGKFVDLGGGRAQIVGVLGPEFELLFPPRLNVEHNPDVYTALRIDWATASRINVFLRLVARLKPDASLGAAQAQVNTVTADLIFQSDVLS